MKLFKGIKWASNTMRLYSRENKKYIDFEGSFKNGLEEKEDWSAEH